MPEVDIGGSLKDLPHPKYKEFFTKFTEIESLPVEQWKVVHLIGYFNKLYKQQYGMDYKFKFNSPAPSKCYEVFQIKKLAQNLTSDPIKLKRYIDWAFQEKVKSAKKRITSIAFLAHEFMTNEYKLKYLAGDLRDQRIDRTTLIPAEYSSVVKDYGYNISTYGELAFLLQAGSNVMDEMKNKLQQAGLNIELIGKIS